MYRLQYLIPDFSVLLRFFYHLWLDAVMLEYGEGIRGFFSHLWAGWDAPPPSVHGFTSPPGVPHFSQRIFPVPVQCWFCKAHGWRQVWDKETLIYTHGLIRICVKVSGDALQLP